MGEDALNVGAPHSWRSIFRDWAAKARIDHDPAEHQLAHVTSAAVRAYQRDDNVELRAPIIEAYIRWLLSADDAKIIPFHRASRRGVIGGGLGNSQGCKFLKRG